MHCPTSMIRVHWRSFAVKIMKTLSPEISDAERAVHHYKRGLLTLVMRRILAVAQTQPYVSAGDIPEDIVGAEHRQGVVSNAWNALKALEIIEQLPIRFMDEERGIIAGRCVNRNPSAKDRWVTCYRLASAARAHAWLRANGDGDVKPDRRDALSHVEQFVEQDLLTA